MLADKEIRDIITGQNSVDDLKKGRFVMAGAGAGKTTAIAGRVLNLIEKLKMAPEKMVIITYTTKAANELITRLRETAPPSIIDARISTVHSFCYDLLREYPIEFNMDPDLSLSDEKSTGIMLDNCLDLMEHQPSEDPGQRIFLDFLETGDQKSINHLKETLLAFFQNRDLEPVRIDREGLKDLSHVEEEMRFSIRQYYNLALQLFEDIIPGCEDDKFYSFLSDGLINILKEKSEREFTDYVLDGHQDLLVNRGRKGSFGNGDLLTELKQSVKDFKTAASCKENLEQIENYNKSLEIYPFFGKTVAEYKEMYGIIDYFDCLYLVRNGLKENSHLRELVQDRFDAVIIDEFQDSDPMQAEIAFLLAGDKQEKLFFVGDPKQSIYGFSRADIDVYLEIMNRMGALELTTNFRSSGGLLDFINSSFSPILEYPGYTPMDKCDEKRDGPFAAENWMIETRLPDEEKVYADTARSREAHMIDGQIRKMMEESGGEITPGDFLILFRTGTAMEAYEKALKNLDIPVLNTKSRNFLRQSDVIELLNLMALCAFPEAELYRAAVDGSDLILLEPDVLDAVLASELSFELKFRKLCGLAGFTSLAINRDNDMFIGLIENLISLAMSELAANHYNKKRTFSDLYEKALNDSFFNQSGISDESLYLQKRKGDAVTLMTIHSSKGLESKVVILAAYDFKGMANKQYVDRENGRILTATPFLTASVAENLSLTELSGLYEKAEKKRSEEEKRVLYVAATRAGERLIVLSHQDSGKNGDFINNLLEVQPPFSGKVLLNFEDFEESFAKAGGFKPFGKSGNKEYRIPDEAYKSITGSDTGSLAVTELIKNPELFEKVKGRKNGVNFGTFNHQVVEYLVHHLFYTKKKEVPIETVLEKVSLRTDIALPVEQRDEVKGMIGRFLESELASDIISSPSVQTEIPFRSAEGYHGIIDLMMEDERSVRIIDFKSDLLVSHGEELKAHYAKQVEYYRKAVEKFTDKAVTGECWYLY